jgi:hypothetical protein
MPRPLDLSPFAKDLLRSKVDGGIKEKNIKELPPLAKGGLRGFFSTVL